MEGRETDKAENLLTQCEENDMTLRTQKALPITHFILRKITEINETYFFSHQKPLDQA